MTTAEDESTAQTDTPMAETEIAEELTGAGINDAIDNKLMKAE